MAKIFETNEDIVKMVEEQFDETGLEQFAIKVKVMSLTKAKEVIRASKASATTEFLAQKDSHTDSIIQVQVYEAAFDRLDDKTQKQLIEMALSGISYDTEKDKIIVDSNVYNAIFRMRRKYGNDFIDKLEASQLVIEAIEQEEKERKEAEKLAKKEEKQRR